jgi:hypothetical protein
MTSTRILVLALLGAAGAATVAVAVAMAGPSGGRVGSVAQLRGVNFVSTCRFSHAAPDDPIVYPGKPGASHRHSFVGNVSTDAYSSLDTLHGAATTCERAEDTAAYWMPTLLVDGQPVEPVGATIYYRRRTLAATTAFPAGLRMIAGSAKATSPQGRMITFWNCGALAGVPSSSEIPTCPARRRTSLRLHVTFPDCWNGSSLDSASHQSHMAYSHRGRCPRTHPVAVPRITLIYRYPTTGGAGVTLASGGRYSAHADFFNAWDQAGLERLVTTCLNALRHCQRGV